MANKRQAFTSRFYLLHDGRRKAGNVRSPKIKGSSKICWSLSLCRSPFVVAADQSAYYAGLRLNVTFSLHQTNNIVGYGRVFNINQAQDSGWTFLNCNVTGIRCADNVLFYAPMDLGPDTADSVGVSDTVYYGSDRLYRSRDRGQTMQFVSQGPLSPIGTTGSGVVVTTIDILRSNDSVRVVGLRK